MWPCSGRRSSGLRKAATFSDLRCWHVQWGPRLTDILGRTRVSLEVRMRGCYWAQALVPMIVAPFDL